MTDQSIDLNPNLGATFIRKDFAPAMAAPVNTTGAVAWLKANMFSDVFSSVLTVLAILLLVWIVPDLVRYLFTDAVWTAKDGVPCRVPDTGACWGFVRENWSYFMYTSYPLDQRWRIDVALIMEAVLVLWLLWPFAPYRGFGSILFFGIYPFVGFWLIKGAPWLGLPNVDTSLWGGMFVSIMVATIGIVFSLPAGILLALGRRSDLPIVKFFSVVFIEFVRGVPFITVLFMANTMLPLFVPEYLTPDRLARPLIATALFASAYMAEIVRGGLQAMPKGQYEGAMALGIPYWKMMGLVVMPQALTIVIPGIVNTFIGLFKDTTLVAVVGTFDFLKAIETRRLDAAWAGPTISTTGYVFAALFYFAFCFGMARYSLYMERKLNAGKRR